MRAYIIVTVAVCAIVYLATAFIVFDLNPSRWGDVRAGCVFFCAVGLLFSLPLVWAGRQ